MLSGRLDTQEEGSALPSGPIAAAFASGRRLQFRLGATLFEEGDRSGRVLLLLSGRCKISTLSADGHETVLAYRGRGDLLGELSAIDGKPHLACVTVTEPGEARLLAADQFIAAITETPAASVAVMRSLVGRLRDADHKRAEFTSEAVVGRVALRLLELAGQYGRPVGDGTLVDLPISQRELAGWVGASREAVNKALAKLEEHGLVAIRRRRIIVRDCVGLSRQTRDSGAGQDATTE